MQCGAGNILDVLDHGNEARLCFLVGFAGREADTAVTHDQRGNAVIGGGAAQRVPGRLAVHVRVHVHPAGCEQFALGIDFLFARGADSAHGDNLAFTDRQIPGERGPAGAINYLSRFE